MIKPPNVYLIGLTGNIACGKSAVVAMLRELGAQTIDADQVTHDLQRPGQPVYDQIVAAFGAGILAQPGGPIDRRALGAIVFTDPAELRRLEQIVHPAVRAQLAVWLKSVGDGRREVGNGEQIVRSASSQPLPATRQPPIVAVIDAIKLIESGWRPICDAIWVVTCTPEQQLARLVGARGMTEAEARARIEAQPPQSEKVAQANVVIDNSGALAATREQVQAAWRAIIER